MYTAALQRCGRWDRHHSDFQHRGPDRTRLVCSAAIPTGTSATCPQPGGCPPQVKDPQPALARAGTARRPAAASRPLPQAQPSHRVCSSGGREPQVSILLFLSSTARSLWAGLAETRSARALLSGDADGRPQRGPAAIPPCEAGSRRSERQWVRAAASRAGQAGCRAGPVRGGPAAAGAGSSSGGSAAGGGLAGTHVGRGLPAPPQLLASAGRQEGSRSVPPRPSTPPSLLCRGTGAQR